MALRAPAGVRTTGTQAATVTGTGSLSLAVREVAPRAGYFKGCTPLIVQVMGEIVGAVSVQSGRRRKKKKKERGAAQTAGSWWQVECRMHRRTGCMRCSVPLRWCQVAGSCTFKVLL